MPNARQLWIESNAVDAQLMARVRERDPAALLALHDRHAGMVLGLAARILGEPGEAADLAQEVFLHLWQQAERFDAERAVLLGWLVSLTRNRAIDRRRARGAPAPGADDGPAGGRRADAGPAAADPNESAFAAELRRAATAALDALPGPERAALELAYFGGLSHGEIAERLDTPPDAVRAGIRQGMARLRDALGDFASTAAAVEPGE